MGLSDCIGKINADSKLPSFSEKEVQQIEKFKEQYKGQPEEVADRLAVRDYAKSINEGLNFMRSKLGLDPVEITDEFETPKTIQDETRDTREGETKESVSVDGETESRDTEISDQPTTDSGQGGGGDSGGGLVDIDPDAQSSGSTADISKRDIELTGWGTFVEKIQDQSIKLRKLQRLVEEESGEEVFGTEADAYNALDTEKNKASARAQNIVDEAVEGENSFMRRWIKEGINFDTSKELNFGRFLHADHAKERNERVREITDERVKKAKSDLDALNKQLEEKINEEADDKAIGKIEKAITKKEKQLDDLGLDYEMFGSGMTDEEVDAFMGSLSSEQKALYEEAAQEFRDTFVSRMIEDRRAAGMLSDEQAERISTFKKYVPLKISEYESIKKSEDKSISEKIYKFFGVEQSKSNNKSDKTAGGKKMKGVSKGLYSIKGAENRLERVDPFIASINEITSVQGMVARNNVIKSFANLVSREGVDIEGVEISSMRFGKEGKGDFAKIKPKFPNSSYNEENSVVYFDDGKMKVIKINDPKLASALLQDNQWGQAVYTHPAVRAFANYFRNVNTVWNPEFMISNFFRDFQNAAALANIENSDIKMSEFTSEVFGAITEMSKMKMGSKKVDPEMREAIEAYEASGAKIGWNSLNSIDAIGKTVRDASKSINEDGTVRDKNALKKLLSGIEQASEVAEHSSRVAVFKILRKKLQDQGDPNADFKAAIAAKEVTVNFNRKGQLGAVLNSAYIFMNAGVQGTSRMWRGLKHSKAVRRTALGLVAIGIAEGVMNDMFGDDDDEYAQLDDFRKERYYNFKLPNQKLIQIPLPYGLSFFKYLGTKAYGMFKLGADGELDAKKMAGIFGDVLGSAFSNFSPIGGGSIGQILAPTALDPIIQADQNINFAGNPIYKDQFGLVETIRSGDGRKNTPEIYKDVARVFNELSLGSPYSKGFIDYNPELYKHWFEWVAGGAGRTATRAGASLWYGAMAMLNPEEVNYSSDEIPMLRQFIRELPQTGDISRIYDLYNSSKVELYTQSEVDKFEESILQAHKKGQIDREYALRLLKSFELNQDIRWTAEQLGVSLDEAKEVIRNR